MNQSVTQFTVLLHAYIVGPTRIVQTDEHAAHTSFQKLFTSFGEEIRKFGGSVLELRGDALVARFPRPSDALNASLYFLKLHQENQYLTHNELSVRVGIALGEIIVADNTVTGAGVLLAQRLEQLAAPNGVCISFAIREALPTRLPVNYESLGVKQLKGFDELVEVISVSLTEDADAPVPEQSHAVAPGQPRHMGLALLTLIIIFVVGGWWHYESGNVDALRARIRAMIFTGDLEDADNLLAKVSRLDTTGVAEQSYLRGLSRFATGDYAQAAEYIKRALSNDATIWSYEALLAATLAKMGETEADRAAWKSYRDRWARVIELPIWIAAQVYSYPFEDRAILENLAEGFKLAGAAERPPASYLKVDAKSRLNGEEIKNTLFGFEIKGTDFWRGTLCKQQRTVNGSAVHIGEPVQVVSHTISHDRKSGESWIEDNRLCGRWPEAGIAITICDSVFRYSGAGDNAYILATDLGPHPFEVSGKFTED